MDILERKEMGVVAVLLVERNAQRGALENEKEGLEKRVIFGMHDYVYS